MKRISFSILAAVFIWGIFVWSNGEEKQPEILVSPAKQANALMNQAGELALKGQAKKAKEIYQKVLAEYPDSPLKVIAQSRVAEVGYSAYFKDLTAESADTYLVQPGDSLYRIAKTYNVTPGLIKSMNDLDSDDIRPFMKLRIMKDRWSLLVDVATNVLVLKAGDHVVKTYPVGTGEEASTPLGEFQIVNRLENPTWYYEGTVAPPGSSDNPLGTRWMGFDVKGYGLHGTTDPSSIGKSKTLGCIRMLNQDVEELFELLPVGTVVQVMETMDVTSQS